MTNVRSHLRTAIVVTQCIHTAGCLQATEAEGESLMDAPTESSEEKIVNGEVYTGHPSVGRLTSIKDCTATLIGPYTVLTAAHCIGPSNKATFQTDDGERFWGDAVKHPDYASLSQIGADSSKNDIAVVLLWDPVRRITPSEINFKGLSDGQKVRLVGFGRDKPDGTSGTKRIATNNDIVVDEERFEIRFERNDQGQGGFCTGDSGAPSFITINGREVLAGIHSTGFDECDGHSTSTRVDKKASWIRYASMFDIPCSEGIGCELFVN